MLFINFLCLFYLMVLTNSHTISKNIAYDTFDDIVDSLHDLDYIRHDRRRHDRVVHSSKEEKQEKEDGTTKGKLTTKKAATLVPDGKPKIVTTTTPAAKKTKPKFWNKIRNRLYNKKETTLKKNVFKRKNRRYRKKEFRFDDDDLNEGNSDSFRRIYPSYDNVDNYAIGKKKRDAGTTETVNPRSTSDAVHAQLTSKFDPKLTPIKTYRPATGDDITQTLSALTTKLSDLKQSYGMSQYRTSPLTSVSEYKNAVTHVSNVTSSVATWATETTTEDIDFLGTAQIEALLNDIKAKAVKMVADQNPAVTDIITNTVTETTFEVDPMLTHMAISSPGFAISTFISIDGPYSKRTVNDPRRNDPVIISNTEPTHKLHQRSIGEDVYTIAQNLEDLLQKELHSVYHKVKHKLSTQVDKEVKEAKTTAKKKLDSVSKEIYKAKSHCPTSVTKAMTKKKKHPSTQKKRRTPKCTKYSPQIKTTELTTQSTYDDYLMLTLFEQMLAKTHENNVMKMLTTSEAAIAKRHHFNRHRRNTESTAFTKDPSKIFDDIVPTELMDYTSKPPEISYSDSTEPVTDTSFEGLSDKICYNDYVNGYRHYLKFQREQGNQNFSNLVKYQAHRHHNVDDIGKFILDKIPQLPTRRRKRFFDDDTMDDQDISTKSDDSWFKKHFYLFIDNGPPKKYHTSQTVDLRSPITESNFEMVSSEKSVPRQKSKMKSFTENSADEEMNLDSLAKSLDDIKVKQFANVVTEGLTTRKSEKNHYAEGNNLFRASMDIVDKIFGSKSGRTASQHNPNLPRDSYISINDIEREKRNLKGHTKEVNNIDNSPITTIKSTIAAVMSKNKNGYVDVDLIPRPTAIVKLRANKQRKSKLKKLLNKLRFRKRNKEKEIDTKIKGHKIAKREQWAKRFNPLKRLKDIFKAKEPEKVNKVGYEIPDYEMMTSHIDTFKPVKYNKVPTVEEIKGQIPNITEERRMDNIIMKHDQIIAQDIIKQTDKPLPFYMPFEVPVVPEVYETTPINIINDTAGYSPMSVSKPSSRKTHRPYATTKKTDNFKALYQTSTPDMDDAMFSNNVSQDNDKYDSYSYQITPTPSLSIEDIRSEIEGIQNKLKMAPTQRKKSTQGLTTETSTSSMTTKFLSNYIINKKMYVPAHLKHTSHFKQNEPKDFKIQTKLTRIAKFPISHFHGTKINPVLESPDVANRNTNLHKRTIEEIDYNNIKPSNINMYATERPRFFSISGYNNDIPKMDRYKPYPDYFNDLLMWHGDLLNTDKITRAEWESVLKGIKQDAELTTHSMQDMLKELAQMKESLGYYHEQLNDIVKSTPRFKLRARMPTMFRAEGLSTVSQVPRNYIKTVALKDNAMAKTNDVIIQGQAKYYHMMKQPDLRDNKYVQADDFINNLNRIYNKKPEWMLNRDAKRNDGFWNSGSGSTKEEGRDEDGNSILFLDTTLLAYDDGPDFLTEAPKPKHKKMSKTSRIFPTRQSTIKPITKTNPSPLQYFSTPMPMKMNDFERFLKDHSIDVQSVTSPILTLPQYNLFSKPVTKNIYQRVQTTPIQKSAAHTNNEKIKKERLQDDFYKKLMSEYTSRGHQTTKPLVHHPELKEYLDLDDKRQKRFSEVMNDRFFTMEPIEPLKKIPRSKVKKMKLFDKKQQLQTTSEPPNRLFADVTPYNASNDVQNQVELTIINMNDMDAVDTSADKATKDKTAKSSKIPSKTTTDVPNVDDIGDVITGGPFIKKAHNQLLFDHYMNNNKDAKDKLNINDPDDATEDFGRNPLPLIDNQIFKKLHFKNQPKRVKISRHSYKYDIIYGNDRPVKRFNNKNVRKYNYNYVRQPFYKHKYNESPYNSDFIETIRKSNRGSEIIKIINAIEAVENFTRPNVEIHIDLPTYYMPDTGPTEKLIVTTQKPWSEVIIKYISGIALLDILNRFGLLTMFEGKLNLTDGLDKAVNACKVFSITETTGKGLEVRRSTGRRKIRQATLSNDSVGSDNYDFDISSIPNWREKRRLKLFSNIQGKLKSLMRRNKPTSTTKKLATTTTKNAQETTTGVEQSITGYHKQKRQKKFQPKFDMFSGSDYEKLVKQVTASQIEKKMSSEPTYLERAKIQTEAELLLNNDEFPDLKALEHWRENSNARHSQAKISTETTTKTFEPLTTQSASKEVQKAFGKKEEVYFDPLLDDKHIYYEPGTTPKTPKKPIQTTGTTLTTSLASHKSSTRHKTTRTRGKSTEAGVGKRGKTTEARAGKREKTTKARAGKREKTTEARVGKRDLQHTSYTAKDVAALEVIVDLVRNAAGIDEPEGIQGEIEGFYSQHVPTTTSRSLKPTVGTNSIQVHIAIPYNLQMNKRRSLDPLRVRRVFAAKMLTPVDLEYQVQSFDDNVISRSTPTNFDVSRPKMYLLIDTNGSIGQGNFTLQPLTGNVDLGKVKVRQAVTAKVCSQKVETTSHGKSLGLGKVTLSKDFVAAVNKHLVQLYENLTAINDTGRHNVKARHVFKDPDEELKGYRRHINWDAVKKYFGHDRVCHCKCKPNKTMCRACAASDAVVSELIFEIDNLNDYMKEHCTEIQTFFWMNPSGGKKLRDSVHRVDQTLRDYYKRVKGKCQGRTCTAFSGCIDRRSIVKKKKMPNAYLGNPLIVDMQLLAKDIDTASKMNMFFSDNFVEEGESLLNTFGECIRHARDMGTANTPKQKFVKNMYSLDNINVNIICKPDSKVAVNSNSKAKLSPSSTMASLAPQNVPDYIPTHFMAYNFEPAPVTKAKKKKFRLFGKKLGDYKMTDIFTYYVTKDEVTPPMRAFKKRQADHDSRSVSWRDYFKGLTPTKLAVLNETESTETTTTSLPTKTAPVGKSHKTTAKPNKGTTSTTTKKTTSSPKKTNSSPNATQSTKKHVHQREINTTDYTSVDTLTYNINELFNIFHNITDLEEMENLMRLHAKKTEAKNITTHTSKANTHCTKPTKAIKTTKNKFHHKHNTTKPHKETTPTPAPYSPIKDDNTSDSTDVNDINTDLDTMSDSIPTICNISIESVPVPTKPTTADSTTNKLTTAKATTTKTTPDKKKTTTTKTKTVVTMKSPKTKATPHKTTSHKKTTVPKESSEPTTEIKETTKSHFLHKIKTATLDFFHSKFKAVRKDATTVAIDDRKSRSPTTTLSSIMNNTNLFENSETSSENLKDSSIEYTTLDGPTVLIINDYDTEVNTDYDDDMSHTKNSMLYD